MEDNKSMEVFAKAPIRKAVLQNALPAMAAMLMVLIYNLADTFFIGQTHDDLQVAAVSLATPVFLLFMSVGTVFGIGGTSVISRALGEGRRDYAKKVCSFCMWCCVAIGVLMSALFLIFMDQILAMIGASAETWDYAKTYLTSLSSIIMNSQMAKYGDMAVAGVGVAMKVTMMTGMVCIGLGQGVQPLLGYASAYLK